MKKIKINFERLHTLRQKLFELIDTEIKMDGHHKSYEGALSINLGSRFKPDSVYLDLHCYVQPFGGRSQQFASLDEFEQFLNDWEQAQKEYDFEEA